MITKNWTLTVDFDRGVTYRPMRFVAGDSGSCSITFTTIQDIEAGLRVFVTFVMSDGTNYIQEATVTDANTAVLELPSGVLSVAGQVNCQVAVHDDSGRLTNAVGFYYTVESDLAEGAIEASDQYPILTQLITDCGAINDAEALRVIAEGEADPRSGRVGAELDRVDAEDAREAAELLRQAHITNKSNPHEVTAAQAGAVPTTRTVNSKALSSDITLSASDVGALPSTDAGDLSNLTTTEKGTIVGAINELDNLVSTKKRTARFVVGTSTAGWTDADCDYLCDGTADQVEINNAITALPATGGEIVILNGTYNITAKIDVTKDNVSIRGNGNATILKRMFNSSVKEGVITLTGRGGCKIANLQIEGNKTIYTNSNNVGIYLSASSNNTVTGNTYTSNNYGIYLSSSSHRNTVTGNTCNNSNYGIYLSASSDNTFTDNTCNNNDTGIYLSASSDNTFTDNTCNNNSNGIYLGSSSSNNTITGNTCNNSNYGIYLAYSSNNTVVGNTCNNNSYGIFLGSSSNNTITGNTCIRGTGLTTDYTESQYTIRLNGTSNNYNLISNNNCMGKAVTNGGGTGNTLVNNKFDDSDDIQALADEVDAHNGNTANPHGVTAAQAGALSTTDAGDLAELTTTEKGSLVGAINEVDSHADTNATSIGTLASLTTTEKTNLVGAINELDTDKVETSAIANTLTETDAGKVLDARQGKTLFDKIGTQTYTEDNYVTDGQSATASIDALDMAVKDNADKIGNQTYTEDNYITDSEPLTESVDKLDMAVKDNATDISTINFNILSYMDDFLPIGASWDKGETPTLTRTDLAVGKTAEIGIDGASATNDFDSMPIYRDIYTITDSLGNKFVRIPKFYIKKTDGVGSKTWQVSKYKHTGYYLPWCFWDFTNSRELPYVDIGCYNGSLDGTKLASKAGTYPLVDKNIVEFRGYAQANNTGGLLGYQQLDIHAIDILRTLYFIEFGTLNSQAIMRGFTDGQYAATHTATATESAANRIVVANAIADLYRVGQAISVGTSLGGNQKFYGRTITGITVVDGSNKAVEFDGAPVDIATGDILYNTGWKSGFSENISASSGVITANDGKYPCSYRGIENPFGSVFQFVDGVNITDNQAWVCRDAGQYASNEFASPYEQLSYKNHNADGYGPVSMGYDSNLPFAEFATSVTGGSTAKYYCDYYYQAAGSRIARFGGYWHSGLNAGLFCWHLSNSSSSTSVALGGRLLKKPL